MVHWNELSDFLKSNPFQTYNVKALELLVPERKGITHFPIVTTPVPIAPVVAPAPIIAPIVAPVVAPVVTQVVAPKRTQNFEILKYTLDPIVFNIDQCRRYRLLVAISQIQSDLHRARPRS